MTSLQFSSRSSALRSLRHHRSLGQSCRLYLHQGQYCQPGRGLSSYSYYLLQFS